MKPTIIIAIFTLFLATQNIVCCKPNESMAVIPEEQPYDMKQHKGTLAELRKIRHQEKLNKGIDKKPREESMPPKTIVPAIKKPARTGSGCLSRTCKLVSSFVSYFYRNNNND